MESHKYKIENHKNQFLVDKKLLVKSIDVCNHNINI